MQINKGLEEDPPASVEVQTKSGQVIDLNNLPGKKKLELILEGEMHVDQFVAPSNLPGKELAKLRAAHKERMDAAIKGVAGDNPYKVGDMVGYKEDVYEVLKTDPEKGVLIERIIKGETKSVWVHYSKVTKG